MSKEKDNRKDKTTDSRIKEIMTYLLLYNAEQTCSQFNISSETLGRYKRVCRARKLMGDKFDAISSLTDKLSAGEIKGLSKVSKRAKTKNPIHDFNGKEFTFCASGDLHIGSKYTNPDNITEMLQVAKKEKCDFIALTGDITEGFSNRPGHMYECTELGYQAQKEKAVEILKQTKLKTYMIDGNHDRWYIKSAGAMIVKDICAEIPNAEFLGHDEGDIIIGNVRIRLWHGEDGSSYATSYRLQKIVESFTGGDKPNILLAGHVHKMVNIFERHIHCFSTGSIQSQSKWMRGKRLSAHTGFWIIKVTRNAKGVGKITSTWYPFYI